MRTCVALAGLVAVLSACQAEAPLAPEIPPPAFRAEVTTLFEGWFPLTPPPGGVPNACTGERILLSGDYHLIVRMVQSDAGHTQFRVHSQVNLHGVGATSGGQYVANEMLNLTQTAGPGESAVFHLTFHTFMISQGGTPNSAGLIKTQLTVNANGEVTADKEEYAFDICR